MNDTSSLSVNKKKKHDKKRSASDVLIQVVPQSAPIVCSFPSGLPRSLQSPSTTVDSPVFQHGNTTLWGQDDTCRYRATKKEESSSSRWCVGLYDKHTQTLTVHAAGSVYCLEQSVPGYQTTVNDDNASSLFADFGSFKKQRVLQSQQAARVSVHQVVGGGTFQLNDKNMSFSNRQAIQEQMQLLPQTTNNKNPAVQAATQTKTWRQQFLPPFDAQATQPNQVYLVEKMAGPKAWTKVVRIVDACWHQSDVVSALQRSPRSIKTDDEKWNHASIRELLHVIDSSTADDSTKKHQFCCALLLYDWVQLYQKWHVKRQFQSRTENPVTRAFLQQFCTALDNNHSFCMSKANQDKCLVHLLLLFLSAQNMSSDRITGLARDLKLSVAQASHFLRLAGCTSHKKGDKVTATLKVPLTFPETQRRGRL